MTGSAMSVPEMGQRNSAGGSTVVVNDEDGDEDAEDAGEEAANGLHRSRAVPMDSAVLVFFLVTTRRYVGFLRWL